MSGRGMNVSERSQSLPGSKCIQRRIPGIPSTSAPVQSKWQLKAALFGLALVSILGLASITCTSTSGESSAHRRLLAFGGQHGIGGGLGALRRRTHSSPMQRPRKKVLLDGIYWTKRKGFFEVSSNKCYLLQESVGEVTIMMGNPQTHLPDGTERRRVDPEDALSQQLQNVNRRRLRILFRDLWDGKPKKLIFFPKRSTTGVFGILQNDDQASTNSPSQKMRRDPDAGRKNAKRIKRSGYLVEKMRRDHDGGVGWILTVVPKGGYSELLEEKDRPYELHNQIFVTAPDDTHSEAQIVMKEMMPKMGNASPKANSARTARKQSDSDMSAVSAYR